MASLSSTGRFSRRFTLLLYVFLSLLFLQTAHAVDTLSDPPTGSCGLPIPGGQRPGTHQEATINKRSYLIFLPSNYEDPNSELSRPLILSFHGGGRTPIQQLDLDNFTSPDFNKDAVVVYPKGENKSWQGVPGVSVDDIGFTQALLDHLTESYCIDKTRIWASGKSDGGGFNGLLACDTQLSQRIAAFAPVSGAFYVKNKTECDPTTISIPCNPGRSSVPFIEFHGGKDHTISYLGGPKRHECLPEIPYYLQEWAGRDELGTQNVTSQLTDDTLVYQFGTDGLVTGVYDTSIQHDWPSTFPNPDNRREGHQPASFNATTLIIEFFEKHGTLPET